MLGIRAMRMVFGGARSPEALVDTFVTSDDKWVVGDTVTFNKTSNDFDLTIANAIHTFPIRNGIQFKISLYGGGGGYHNGSTSIWGSNANGNTLITTIDLSAYADTNLYIVRGAGGQNASTSIDGSEGTPYDGGFNGGGDGAGSAGAGGGGRTDLRIIDPAGNQELQASRQSELLVAAGGGGGTNGYSTSNYSRYYGDDGNSGDCGGYPCDNAGSGAGYYGGISRDSDDGRQGSSGFNYYDAVKTITVHTNTRTTTISGGNQYHGYFVIEVISVS